MNFIKPKKLQKGDTIGIVTQSWGGPGTFPHIYENGIKKLKELGFKIKEFNSTKKDEDFIYKNPKKRAQDINDAFADKEVKAIFSSIGGDDSIRILEYLDTDLITKNPKMVLGYSDFTTINTYLNQLGLVTFNGPSIMAGFSQYDAMPDEFKKHINDFLFEIWNAYEYKKFEKYCEGYLDWSKEENVGKTNKFIKDKLNWCFLQGEGVIEGKLFGGCIEVLEFMKGTKFWPKKDFFTNKILFLETSEDIPTLQDVQLMLRNYGIQGIFDEISALVFGRVRGYNWKTKKSFNDMVLQVVNEEFGNYTLPIITNLDFGHTDPQWILPLGICAQIDFNKKSFKLIENPFE
jgi:muramoyltetrapeptide carboxypeptidase LdcA involved in peptidoglycan recycling